MSEYVRNRELDEPNALVERIAQAVHSHILATEPQTTGAQIVAVIRGFIRNQAGVPHVDMTAEQRLFADGFVAGIKHERDRPQLRDGPRLIELPPVDDNNRCTGCGARVGRDGKCKCRVLP